MATLLEDLAARIRALEGVEEKTSKFSSALFRAWSVGGREFAHVHTAEQLDIRLPRERQRELRDDPRATFRKHASAWMEFTFQSPADLETVFSLVQAAWEQARTDVAARRRKR